MNEQILYGPFNQVVTMDGLPSKGAITDEQLQVKEQVGLLVENGIISVIDDYSVLNKQGIPKIEFKKESVVLPGFVDSHTHICFGGSRANDYAMRNAGKSYLEIAKAGGGIWDTVKATRTCSQEELTLSTIKRANRHLKSGVTTIEVKSGYGLSVSEELKMLRAIKSADAQLQVDLISTCLAAHVKPKDFEGDHGQYLTYITDELLPKLKAEQLTGRVDIFVEEGAFDIEVSRKYLKYAQSMGFAITLHADQFHVGGSGLAVELKALSADHLEVSGSEQIKNLANSEVIATALPGASMGLGCDYTPARAILDLGGRVAIASDWNPGSAPMGDLLLQAALLGTFQKLSNAEALAGITLRGAQALGLTDRGVLKPGMKADFNVFETDNYQEILYQQGMMRPAFIIKNGVKINTDDRL